MNNLYLNPHQTRNRAPTTYEDLLADAIERAYAAGIHDLASLVAYLNRSGPNCPSGLWSEASYQAELARLALEC